MSLHVHYYDRENGLGLSFQERISMHCTHFGRGSEPSLSHVKHTYTYKICPINRKEGSTSEIFILCIRHPCHIILTYRDIFSRGLGPDNSLARVLRIAYSEVRLLDEQTENASKNQSDESGHFLSISFTGWLGRMFPMDNAVKSCAANL